MSKVKKISVILFFVFAMFMLGLGITFGGIKAGAEGTGETPTTYVAQVGTTKYKTLNEAVTNATAGDTVTLLADTTLATSLTIEKSLTLDLGGKTVTIGDIGSAKGGITIDNVVADVTITNGTVIFTASGVKRALYVANAKSTNINNVLIKSTNSYGGINIESGETTIELCTLECSRTDGNVYGISVASKGKTTIKSCTSTCTITREAKTSSFDGASIYVKSDTVCDTIIDNCKLTATAISKMDDTSENKPSALHALGIYNYSTRKTKICNKTEITASSNGYNAFSYGVYNSARGKTEVDDCIINGKVAEVSDENIVHTDNSYGFYLVTTCSGTTTITNSKISGGYGGFENDSYAMVNISDCEINSANYGVLDYGTGDINLVGCKISSEKEGSVGISGNGTYHGTVINLTDTEITADAGIYHPQDGTLTINGGKIDAKLFGVEIRAGNLTVNNNAEITVSKDTEYIAEFNESGSTVTGAAIAVSQHTTNKPISVTVNSATLSAKMAIAQVDFEQISDPVKSEVVIAVNGGTFDGGVTATERVGRFINSGNFKEEVNKKYLSESSEITQGNSGFVAIPKVDIAKQEASEAVRQYAEEKKIAYTDDIKAIIFDDAISDPAGVDDAKNKALAKIDALFAKLEQAKAAVIARLDSIVDSLINGDAETSTARTLLQARDGGADASASRLSAERREKLQAKFGEKIADHIEQDYNKAVAAVENAATAEEAEAAADRFQASADTVKALDAIEKDDEPAGTPSIAIYVLLSITVALAAVALVVALAAYRKKKRSDGTDRADAQNSVEEIAPAEEEAKHMEEKNTVTNGSLAEEEKPVEEEINAEEQSVAKEEINAEEETERASAAEEAEPSMETAAVAEKSAYEIFREEAEKKAREQTEQITVLEKTVKPLSEEEQARVDEYRAAQRSAKAQTVKQKPPTKIKTEEEIAAQKARAAARRAEKEAFLASLTPEQKEHYAAEQKAQKERAATIRKLKKIAADRKILEKLDK